MLYLDTTFNEEYIDKNINVVRKTIRKIKDNNNINIQAITSSNISEVKILMLQVEQFELVDVNISVFISQRNNNNNPNDMFTKIRKSLIIM